VPIVLVAVSSTNDENDIDEKNLEIIKPGGTVVCLSFWYRKAFPWLLKRKCNVIYANYQINEDVFDYLNEWHYITFDLRQDDADAVRHLKECGSKNPAFISMLYHNKLTKLLHPFVFQHSLCFISFCLDFFKEIAIIVIWINCQHKK